MSRERHKLYERMGRFVVEKDDIDSLPDWFQQMMARVIVLRAGFSMEADGVEYLALCPQFDRHHPGNITPVYRPVVEDGRFLRFGL